MGFLNEQLEEEEKAQEEPKKAFPGVKIEQPEKKAKVITKNPLKIKVEIEDSDKELMLNMIAKDIAKGIVNILKKYEEADISDMKEAFEKAYEMVNTKSLDEVLKNER